MNRNAQNNARRARRARAVLSVLLVSFLPATSAAADDPIGIVVSATPSGATTKSLTMRIPTDASSRTIPVFLRHTGDGTLYGVRLHATPLRGEDGAPSVTPVFDRTMQTLPSGAVRRSDLNVSRLTTLGNFTSTLYATHGNRTQTLGTLSVLRTLRTNDLRISPIDPARSSQLLPRMSTSVGLLMTITNAGEEPVTFSAPVISRLIFDGADALRTGMPTIRVVGGDAEPAAGPFVLAAGEATTIGLVIDGVRNAGAYRGVLRVSAGGHEPVEQTFAFRVKQGPLLPVILVLAGVAVAYLIRRRSGSSRIGRRGRRRMVERLLSDLNAARDGLGELEPRETRVLETLERRLVDISDELELARSSTNAAALLEIDRKIDLFISFVPARRHVGTITPTALQAPYEAELDEAARFLTESMPPPHLQARTEAVSRLLADMPRAVEASVRERFRAEVERLLGAMEASPTVVNELPIRVLNRVGKAKQLAEDGRFAQARAELAAAQGTLARLLAEELIAAMPDAGSPPPGFDSGWPRFRSAAGDALRKVRNERRGDRAADRYRRVWQEYVVESTARLRSSAARERRRADGARREQLERVITACDAAMSKAGEFDPETSAAYRVAVEEYLTPAGRKTTRIRSILADAQMPPPMTVVAAGVGNAPLVERVAESGTRSAASLASAIQKRHSTLALVAGILSVPAGLVLLWAPNETWGDLTDGAAVFSFGLGMHAILAMLDGVRLGGRVAREAAAAPERVPAETRTAAAPSPRMRPEREPTG